MLVEEDLPPQPESLLKIPVLGGFIGGAIDKLDRLTNSLRNSEPSGEPVLGLGGASEKLAGMFKRNEGPSDSVAAAVPTVKETPEVSSEMAVAQQVSAPSPDMQRALAQFHGVEPMRAPETAPEFGHHALPSPGHTPAVIQQASLGVGGRSA